MRQAVCVLLALLTAPVGAAAQSLEAFYKANRVTMASPKKQVSSI